MDPHVVDKKSEEPDRKRQKLDVDDEKCEVMSSSSESPFDYDSDDVRLFEEEYSRSGAYDFDISKVGRYTSFRPVIFENNRFVEEPDTDGDLIERLCKIALKKRNDDKSTSLELVRAVKAIWSLGGGHIFSITLEAKDASHTEPIPFLAKVRYLPGGTTVFDVKPKP